MNCTPHNLSHRFGVLGEDWKVLSFTQCNMMRVVVSHFFPRLFGIQCCRWMADDGNEVAGNAGKFEQTQKKHEKLPYEREKFEIDVNCGEISIICRFFFWADYIERFRCHFLQFTTNKVSYCMRISEITQFIVVRYTSLSEPSWELTRSLFELSRRCVTGDRDELFRWKMKLYHNEWADYCIACRFHFN